MSWMCAFCVHPGEPGEKDKGGRGGEGAVREMCCVSVQSLWSSIQNSAKTDMQQGNTPETMAPPAYSQCTANGHCLSHRIQTPTEAKEGLALSNTHCLYQRTEKEHAEYLQCWAMKWREQMPRHFPLLSLSLLDEIWLQWVTKLIQHVHCTSISVIVTLPPMLAWKLWGLPEIPVSSKHHKLLEHHTCS